MIQVYGTNGSQSGPVYPKFPKPCLFVAQCIYRVDAARATRRNPDGQQSYNAQEELSPPDHFVQISLDSLFGKPVRGMSLSLWERVARSAG